MLDRSKNQHKKQFADRNAPMVLAEPKTIHNLKDLENKFVTPSGDPDKSAYR